MMPPVVERNYIRDDDQDPLDCLNDLQLYREFRMDKDGILFLTTILQNELQNVEEQRGQPVKAHIMIMVSLLYLATNTFQLIIARRFKLSQATVSRCIAAFVKALSSKVNDFVVFPRSDEAIRRAKLSFYDVAHMPGVVSAIDGTHVPIPSPSTDGHQYRCRKGYPSINVQLACDAEGLFTNVVARWPGSSHDSYVLRNSLLYTAFENGSVNGIIVGDSAYPCKRWLLTPYANPVTDAEKRYNTCQKRTRVIIECSIGRMKRRFACLNQLRLNLDIVPAAISSCVILHNLIQSQKIKQRVLRKFNTFLNFFFHPLPNFFELFLG